MLEEGHHPVQDLNELVYVDAGLYYEIRTLLYGQIIETGAMVAKEHQSVVEGLVVRQIFKSGSQVFPCVSVL